MRDFHPEREKFIDSSGDNTWRSTNQDVERFIASDTVPKMCAFLKGAPSMFEPDDRLTSPDDIDFEDAFAARRMLELALLAREASRNDECVLTEESLADYELVAMKPSSELQGYLRTRAQLAEAVTENLAESTDEQAFLNREMGYNGTFDPDAPINGIGFNVYVPTGGYADFLIRMVEADNLAASARGTANRWSIEQCIVDEDGSFHPASEGEATYLHLLCAMGYYESSDSGVRAALSNLCDFLMTLHMGDMRTIVIDGQEVRSIATGIGSLWWSALDAMRIGRLGACEVCGKPFIANNERGKRRKYCTEACKQWRKVHPGETRVTSNKPIPPERA